jgi:hypothetical protein
MAIVHTEDFWADKGFLLTYNQNFTAAKARKKADPKSAPIGKYFVVEDAPMPARQYSYYTDKFFSERDAVLLPFLNSRDVMIKDVRALLNLTHPLDSNFSTPNRYQHPTHQGPSVLVMCINWGHMQLLLNFVCAMRGMGIQMPPHIIFASSERVLRAVQRVGLVGYYHPHLGDFSAHQGAAGAYADDVFGVMMWLKTFSVYIALEAGADVLFQDVDNVWNEDPIPALRAASERYNTQWMDDGARTRRFAPYFANSGFFYLRNTYRVRQFWDQVRGSGCRN